MSQRLAALIGPAGTASREWLTARPKTLNTLPCFPRRTTQPHGDGFERVAFDPGIDELRVALVSP